MSASTARADAASPAPSRTMIFQNDREPRHWFMLAMLVATVPAFYLELLSGADSWIGSTVYALAAIVVLLAERPWRRMTSHHRPVARRGLVSMLIAGLLASSLLPASSHSTLALVLRSVTALLTLVQMLWCLRHLLVRDSLPALLATAVVVLILCGAGFWWLEPRTPTLEDGLWLAFTTAATVGYGDIVPTTTASKIFSVFVVLLGFGILSLVTASIAAMWVERTEREVEGDILHDLHAEIGQLRRELRATHAELHALKQQLDRAALTADTAPDQPPR